MAKWSIVLAPHKLCIFHFSEKDETKIAGEDDGEDKKAGVDDKGIEKDAESSDNIMDTSETKTVSSQSIIGQICFDLGTLYFYKGNIEKAKSLFETCSSVQVSSTGLAI